MRLRPLALGLLFCAGGGTAAWAQQAPQMPEAGGARTMQVGLRLAGSYDSNISRSSKALALSRGLSQDDYLLTPAITANILQPLGRQAIFLQGSAGYDYHRYNSQLDRGRADITGGGYAAFAGCREGVTANYRASQSDLATLDVRTTKNLQQSTGVSVALDCSRPNGLSGSVVAAHVDTKNSADVLTESDLTTENVGVNVIYGNPTLGYVSLTYAYATTEFPNRIIPGRPIGDGFFTETIGGGYERNFGTKLTVAGQLSRTELKREFSAPGTPLKTNGTTYAANVEYRLGSRIRLRASANRAFVPSQQVGKTFDRNTDLQGSITYNLGSRFVLNAGYDRKDLKSNGDTASNLIVVTNSRTKAAFGAVTYKANRRASLVLDLRHEDRKANLPSFNYTATRVGLTAAYSF
jgi:hypothetical protein